MAIDKDEIRKKYPDTSVPVEKPGCCNECPFEEILKYGIKNKVSNLLERDIPKDGPDREFIEQICGKKYNGVCYIKYEVERMNCGDYFLGQLEAARILRRDINKARELNSEEKFIENLEDIMNEWVAQRNSITNKKGDISSYAERWSEVWHASLGKNGRHTLTEIGIYRYVVSENGNYKIFIEDLEKLKKEEEERDKNGINISLGKD